MQKKLISGIVLILITAPICAVLGQFLAGFILSHWLKLENHSSLTLLYSLFVHKAEFSLHVQQAIKVCAGMSVLIAILPLIGMLALVVSNPKRELHGNTRFASTAEIKKTGLLNDEYEQPDVLIGKYKGKYLRWGGNEFAYLAAPTRSGKGVGIVVPNCLHYRDSLVVFDPKLENFLLTSGFRAKHGHKVFLFNPSGRMPEHESNANAPMRSHRWNPFTYVRRNPLYTYKDAMNMAHILYPKGTRNLANSDFFNESAQKLFVGLVLYLIEIEHEAGAAQVTLANLFRLTAPSGLPLAHWIKYQLQRRTIMKKPELSDQCKTLLLGFANGNDKTNADIVSTLTAPLAIFIDPVVEAATSADDFFLNEVRQKRMSIYLGIIPTEVASFSRLTNLFFSQLISVNVQQGLPENNPKLKHQCLLMMDEFSALGAVPTIEQGVAYIAGYNLRLFIIFQSPSQINSIYSRDNARTFFTNFSCQIVFPPRDQNDAREYSEMIGYQTVKARSRSRSRGKATSQSYNDSDQKRALMLPDELKTMPKTDCIISLNSLQPIYAQKIVYFTDEVFKHRAKLPTPKVNQLSIEHTRSIVIDIPEAKPTPIPAKELADTELGDTSNAQNVLKQVLASIVPPNSSPEYIASLSKVVQNNVGVKAMPIINKILKPNKAAA